MSTIEPPFDPVKLVLETINRRRPKSYEGLVVAKTELLQAGAQSVPLAMALAYVFCARLAETRSDAPEPAGFWRQWVDWEGVAPSGAAEDLRGRVERMLTEMWRFRFHVDLDPDITLLRDMRDEPNLTAALYWTAREFASVGDEDREDAACELIGIVGLWHGLSEVP